MEKATIITKARHRFIICLTLWIAVCGVGVGLILHRWLPEHYPALYPSIPFFFYVYGLVFIAVYGLLPEKGLQLYLLGKGVKLIGGVMFLLAYSYGVGTHIKSFMILFFGYYLVYLIFESLFFLRLEQSLKKEKEI